MIVQKYIDDYTNLETFLNNVYSDPIDQGFDWYSPMKEPSFLGKELVDGELAMISTREIDGTIISHMIMYSEEHMNHTIAWTNIIKRTREQVIQEFENTYSEVLRK